MSTFLELCQNAVNECGISTADNTPSAVASQTGILRDVVGWVKNGYVKLQNRTNWLWLRRPFTFDTVAGTQAYAYGAVTDVDTGAVIARFRRWWVDDLDRPPLVYLKSAGVSAQKYLLWLPIEDFYWRYLVGVNTTVSAPPVHITVDDKKRILIGPKPDGVYTVTGDFQRGAQVLALDGDVPELPVDFHQLLVYEAMKRYAGKKNAPEVMSRATLEGNPLLRQLERDQGPNWRLGPPLA